MSPATATPQANTQCKLDIARLDLDCQNFLNWKDQERYAKDKADKVKAIILATVEQHGFVPNNAEKSRRVEARKYVATVTTGTAVEISDEKVTALELLLSQARCPKMFSALFDRRVDYSLAKTAAVAIKTTLWPKRFAEDIRSLYATCFQPKTKTPSLDVESRAAIAERERIATEKAEAKLRKRAGKADA
jgi:hypothetical protein